MNKLFMRRWMSASLSLWALGFLSIGLCILLLSSFYQRIPSLADYWGWSEVDNALAGILIGGQIVLCLHISRLRSGPVHIDYNFAPSTQVEKISALINSCERELIVFSGKFNSAFYGNEDILTSLRGLTGQSVILFARDAEIDVESSDFEKLCSDRGWKVVCGAESQQAHFMIVDGVDCRIEFPSSGDDGNQFAVYYTGRPDYCRRLMSSFQSNVMKRDPGFDRTKFSTLKDSDV